MKRYSVDVVILPPPDIAAWAVTLNKTLQLSGEQKIGLDTKACLPHLSLGMATIERAALPKMQEIIENLGRLLKPLPLTASGSVESALPEHSEPVTSMAIEATPQLTSLHEKIVRALQPLKQAATPESFYTPPPINDFTVGWVDNYISHSSFSRFSPHITLGFGTLSQPITKPRSFMGLHLAVCHLGNYCTCRAVLGQTFLSSKD